MNQTNHHTNAVLWDLDGTLVDTADCHWLAWQDIMAVEHYPLTYEQFIATFGQRNDNVLRRLFGPGIAATEIERISHAKETRYRELVLARGVKLLPGAAGWLRQLAAGGWRQAIASSAPRLNIDAILQVLGIEEQFDAVVAAEDVQRGKPDPQVFLMAAARLSVPARRCVVVEDSPAGIEGAHRAGMAAIGVGSAHGGLPADRTVGSLADLPADAFAKLVDGRIPAGDR